MGLSGAELACPHAPCEAVGQQAFDAGCQGVIAPAATSLGEVLCVFAERADLGALTVVERRFWELPADPRG